MLHGFILAAQQNPEAAGFILKGIKGIFVAIGSIIAAYAGDRDAARRAKKLAVLLLADARIRSHGHAQT